MNDERIRQTETEVRSRLQRELRAIPVRPYAEYRARALEAVRPRPRPIRIAAALATGLALVVLALAVGSGLADLRRNVAAPPSATPGPTAAASPTPSTSPSPEPSPTPLPSGRPAGGIEAYPLGALRGEYAFVVNGGANTMPGAVTEVWAVPLAAGQPRLAVRFANSTTPATASGENRLARQFSPDGRRLVLAAATPRSAGGERIGLFVVELETGRVSAVGVEDAAEQEKPAWSPDGRRIAYVRRPIIDERTSGALDDGVWVMNVDGTGQRKVALLAAGAHPFPRTHIDGWAPDGRLAWSYSNVQNTLTLTDVDSGTHTTIRTGGDVLRGPSFRTAVPRIAASFSDRPVSCPGHYVAVVDGAPERVLVRAPERPQCALRIHSVRWDPARDEILYLLERETAPHELYVVELSGATRRLASGADPVIAEWSAAGTRILYVQRNPGENLGTLPFAGSALRYVRRDGSDERTLFSPRAPAALSDIAVRLYQ